ncbi:MAG: sulfotransferase domain-containing protein [Caulobacteraceae bacterium]
MADLIFRVHGLNRHTTNLSLLKYYDFQGFLITGQNSGTHWIKWMLSHALAHRYGVEPPRYFNNDSSNDLIGHPKHERIHPHLPRIASSHSIPAYALDWAWLRTIRRPPPYAVVVRDIRKVLVSHYEKWRDDYGVPFNRYVAGDPRGAAYACDVWWYMRFLNRWGDIARRHADETLVLRYEDFRTDPLENLRRLARHFRLDLTDRDLLAGVAVGSKEHMMAHQDPQITERPIRPDGAAGARFSPQDLQVLAGILDRNLKHDFGYRYFAAPRGFQIPPAPRGGRLRTGRPEAEPVRDAA